MRWIKRIALFVALAVVALVGVAYLLPRKVHVERATLIEAPPATVFTLLNGYRRFNEWSPWSALDPNATYERTGPETGEGAKLAWKGDPSKVGEGSQTIIESRPFERVRSALDFGSEGTAIATFALAPEGKGTRVTWGFDTDLGLNPIGRYFGLAFERMMGPDFERGLAGLKTLAEQLPAVDFATLDVRDAETRAVRIAYVEASAPADDAAIAAAIGAAYQQVGGFMAERKLTQSGAPLTINTRWDESGYGFEAAIPVQGEDAQGASGDGPVKLKDTYAGKVLKAVHKGSYHTLRATYEQLMAYAGARGLQPAGPPWDEYVSDPGATPEAELITNIYFPVQ